jgi:hypothetical protein
MAMVNIMVMDTAMGMVLRRRIRKRNNKEIYKES